MATITRESIGTLHDTITVKLEKTEYMPAVDKSVKEYAKKAAIPGFRKGMVPVGLVRKMYGQSVLTDEVIRMAGNQLEEYLKNQHLSIFAQPLMLPSNNLGFDINNPGEYDFSFEIGIKPEFDIPAVTGKAALNRYKIIITDKMLDDETARLCRQHGNEEIVDTASTAENIVHLVYHNCNPEGVVTDADNKTTQVSEFGKLPAKLQELLAGKKAGDSLVFVPAEVCNEEELANFLKTGVKNDQGANDHFLLTIEKISLVTPLEVGTDLFEKVYPGQGVADAAAFREKLREELLREYGRLTGERLQNEIFEMLVHTTPIALPDAFLKRYLAEGTEKTKTMDVVESEYPGFEHSLRWQLISDKLMAENHISVSRDEVLEDVMNNVLSYFGVKNIEDAPWLESYKARISKDEKMMDETYNRLLVNKLFTKLEEILSVAEVEIEESEFFKLADAHAAHHHHH